MTRLQKFVSKLNQLELDSAIIKGSYNIRYLSGFTGTDSYLYISKNSKKLLTDFRYTEQAEKQATDFEIIDYRKDGLFFTLNNIMKEENARNIGFEDNIFTYKEYIQFREKLHNVKLISLGDIIERIRMIKDEKELEYIKKAASIGDLAYKHILEFVRPSMTEKEIAFEIENCMKKNGAEKLSFDTIVASGINSSLPHAIPTDKKIEEGDFVTLDFGCIYKGYCSDMTRTFVFGKANQKQKEIYNIVLQAQLKALDEVKSGCVGREIDKIARDFITQKGYGQNFGHGLGHCVGLYIHEDPRFSIGDETVFQENMVVTVEPGIYIPGFGGVRIEDLVCVTKDGVNNFVSSPKQLIEVV